MRITALSLYAVLFQCGTSQPLAACTSVHDFLAAAEHASWGWSLIRTLQTPPCPLCFLPVGLYRVWVQSKAGVLAINPQQVFMCAPSLGVREFSADVTLNPHASQSLAYESSALPVVADWLNGVNACMFVFGQTGSGKTHTMFGPDDMLDPEKNKRARGVVPRIIQDTMDYIASIRKHGVTANVAMSYVEVFGNDILNLLDDGAAVGAWHGVAARTVLDGHASRPVASLAEATALLQRGEQSKRKAATAMNDRSSRAHAVLVLTLEKTLPSGQAVKSQLCLADLGGSEQLKKSKAEGDRMLEAIQINQGLLSLKQCITALHEGSSHVPFWSSTLTSLLQDALGGRSRTSVLIAASMDPRDSLETMHALRFGELCRSVKNEAGVSINASAAAVAALNEQLAQLQERISKEERWETVHVTRKDIEGDETVVKSVLVGAEKLRTKYEEILATRDNLVGGF